VLRAKIAREGRVEGGAASRGDAPSGKLVTAGGCVADNEAQSPSGPAVGPLTVAPRRNELAPRRLIK